MTVLAALTGRDVKVLVLAAVALIAVALVVGLLMMYYRRKSMKSPTVAADFSIDDLEGLRSSGLISNEEFRQLRRKAMNLQDNPKAPKSSAPPPEDDGVEGSSHE